MTSTLPPDPYIALGVAKGANLPEIRSAHRKLVLKCHPDKVQDAALKAIKQDEFQKVQQAYELLSDVTKRLQYDEQVKLFELRKEMGRGNPTARSNPFEYEIRTAEPRTTSTTYTTRPSPKVYSHPPPRSYEDVMYEEPPRGVPRKTASYETDRKRTSAREEERERDRRRYHDEEEERVRRKAEKESKRSEHGKEKKNRDKERRKGAEEKIRTRTTAAYVQSDDSDDYRSPRSSEKKSQRHRMEEDIREREDAARAAEATRARHAAREREREPPSIKSAPLDPKWDEHMDFAGKYMQAARRKVCVDDSIQHPGMRRADTFTPTTATYNVRHVAPQQYSDDDSPRRSSARKETTRRTSDTPQVRTREKSSRRSPVRDPYIIEPPSPPPMMKKPTLQTHSSAPPNTTATYAREKPSRSKTQDYPRKEPIPTVSRAQTFNVGDRGSRLKKQVDYSSDSDSDSPVQPTARYSHSPPRRAVPEPTRYIIDNGRSVPITKTRHRSELRNISPEHDYRRERSESPGTRHTIERPPMARNSSDRPHAMPTRSQSHNYYTPDLPEPIVLTARPKGSPREGSHRSTRGGAGPYFGEVKYAPQYGQEHVIYSAQPPADVYRRGSDPSHHRDYYPSARGGREQIYT